MQSSLPSQIPNYTCLRAASSVSSIEAKRRSLRLPKPRSINHSATLCIPGTDDLYGRLLSLLFLVFYNTAHDTRWITAFENICVAVKVDAISCMNTLFKLDGWAGEFFMSSTRRHTMLIIIHLVGYHAEVLLSSSICSKHRFIDLYNYQLRQTCFLH